MPVPLLRTTPLTQPAGEDRLTVDVIPFWDPLTGDVLPVRLLLPGEQEIAVTEPRDLNLAPGQSRVDLVLQAGEPPPPTCMKARCGCGSTTAPGPVTASACAAAPERGRRT